MKKLITATLAITMLSANSVFANATPVQNISVNGVPTGMEVINIDGRNLAKSDDLLKAIGINTEITKEDSTSITFDGITFKNDSDVFTVNDEEFKMDTKPIVKDDILYLPVKYVLDSEDINYSYDNISKTTDIVLKNEPVVQNFSGTDALEYANKYTSFGIHRTGTETEIESTKWVASELENIGFDTQLQELKFNRFDLKNHKLIVDGKEIDSFPFWFPVATGSEPVEAKLTMYDEEKPETMKGKVVYYDMPGLQTNADISAIAEKAKEAGAVAVISTVIQPNGLPSGQNTRANNTENAIALPSLIVSASQKDVIKEAADKNAEVSVLIEGESIPDSVAYNVIAKLDNNADEWVVVTTPLSGWFVCNAERGGGVGLFLELAQNVKNWDSNVNYLFIGNTGHELNFSGAHESEQFVPEPEDVKVWLHCGSSIAAKEPIVENFEFIGFSQDIAEDVNNAFKDVEGLKVQNDEAKLMQSELGSFISKGYSAFGFFGANKDFHTEADNADGISLDELTVIGQKATEYLENISK